MNPYWEKLRSELADREDGSVLEALYFYYRESHPTNSETIQKNFSQLNAVLEKLTLQECDQVWDLVCALCGEHEREGFLEGLYVGAGLATELAEQ